MSPDQRRESLQFEGIFSPRSPLEYLGYCVLTISLSGMPSLFGPWAYPFFAAFLVLLFALMWYRERQRARTRSQQLTFQVTKEQPRGARGLILLVSPFDPRDATLKEEQALLPKIAAVADKPLHQLTEADFSTINLQGSNLRPLIDAVAFHAGENTLRDVWLITTQSDPTATGNTAAATGSEQAGQILAKYLGYRYGERVQVHKDGLCVKAWDYGDLWKKAEDIFRTSGYKDEVLLADVTGGTKMMSVALAMACIPPNRKMQYMDSERDWQGQPLGAAGTRPVVIDVDPILYPSH